MSDLGLGVPSIGSGLDTGIAGLLPTEQQTSGGGGGFSPLGLVGAPARVLPSVLPRAVTSPFAASAPAIDPNYQRNLTTLTNKYAEMSEQLAALPEPIRNALIQYDSARVSKGSNPLTKEQTLNAIETALNNQPATPEPERNITNVFGNFRSNLSDILKSIPRLPLALVNEAKDMTNFAGELQENQAAGMNPLAALLNAPGVRMVPGAYIAGNLAQGGKGIRELVTNPLFTALDVLPGASKAAAATDVGRLSIEAAEQAGRRARPLTGIMTGRVLRDANGELVRAVVPGSVDANTPALGRNALGRMTDVVRNETAVGQALDAFGGRRSRDVSRARGGLEQRFGALFEGYAVPENLQENFAKRAGGIFKKYEDQYEFLKTDRAHAGPDWDRQRAEFYNTLQRAPETLDPVLVGEYRELTGDMAKYLHGEGKLGLFDDEWYDTPTAKKLISSQQRVRHGQMMMGMRNAYLSPDPSITVDALRQMADDVASIESRRLRGQAAVAFEQVIDAYGGDYKALQSARAGNVRGSASPADWRTTVDSILDDPAFTPTAQLDAAAVAREIRRVRPESRLLGKLEQAIMDGNRADTTKYLSQFGKRKDKLISDDLRSQARSASRRVDFDNKVGKMFTDQRVAMRERAFERTRNANAPARYDAILGDEVRTEATTRIRSNVEQSLGKTLTPDEAGQLASAVTARAYTRLPGIDPADAEQIVRTVEREVTATWRDLREKGLDPVFVHRVSPGRANQALAGNINPVPVSPSQTKRRVMDLSPSVQDVQVSLRHQAGEILQQQYNERFVDEVIERVGKTQRQLRDELVDEVYDRMAANPSLDFEGTFSAMVKRRYEKFNPDEAGASWGGVKLDKYRQEDWYIPKSIASNLHSYAKPPSIMASMTDPVTKAFRYSVIGLSPSVVINNFFSNSVAMAANSGLAPWKHWSTAREWLADPSKVPDESLRAMMVAEIPNMESVSRDAWLASRSGTKLMAGFNAGQAFMDSAAVEAAKTGKRALDVVVEKSMNLQRLGDNVYRAMQYMDEHEKLLKAGKNAEQAAHGAMEMVRRTFVDYTSFTPIERSAMRTIIPFYSYMGHAARFIFNYPFDHPMRADITARLADAERDRLGALPGSFLSMVPMPGGFLGALGGGMDENGKQNFLALRPFDPFGDMSDMLSVSGWLSATNPMIQTALAQAGVFRGEAELYPTLRYDPETGRMKAVRGNLLSDLFHNTLPRAGLLTAALGVNSQYNDVRERDPDAANRMLVSMAGVPRVWRSMSPFQDMFKSEVSRMNSANDVKNEALKSGNWSEAMRYPSLRELYDEVSQISDADQAALTPQSPDAIATALRSIVGG